MIFTRNEKRKKLYFIPIANKGADGASQISRSNEMKHDESKIPLRKRILIVDDNEDFREALFLTLKSNEVDAVVVDSGTKALDVLKSNCFDFILLDLLMPEMDGAETFQKILATYKDSRVIIMTAYSDIKKIEQVKKLNPFAFLRKPFDLSQLLSCINNSQEENRGKRKRSYH